MSKIEWTDATWNPFVGCSKISTGCDHCYAIGMAARFANQREHYTGVVSKNDWTGVVNLAHDAILQKPLNTRKPTVYFVNSMSDMFHENVPDEWLSQIFKIMNDCPHHIFQVLTKRPSRMVKKTAELALRWSPNMWAGCTVEDDKFARVRVREIQKVPASVRFISAEPLVSALPSLDVSAVDWVIAGGESGNVRTIRPSNPDWYRDLRDRCRSAGTPFFFKQWGAFGVDGVRRSKAANGHLLDGEQIFEVPAVAYDMIPNPSPNWTRVNKGQPPEARQWNHPSEFRNEMFHDPDRNIKIHGEAARVALRAFILDDLAEHGANAAIDIRGRVIPAAGLDAGVAYHVNQHAWALVDLQREGKVAKVGGKPVRYDLANAVSLVGSATRQVDADIEEMWAALICPGSTRLS